MKHTPKIRSPLAWDWKRTKDYWPGKAVVITVITLIILLIFPLTRGVLKGVYKILQWDPWAEISTTTGTRAPAVILKEEKKPLSLVVKGDFEEVGAWEIKIPESPCHYRPTHGLVFVLPPESDHDVRVEGQTNSPTTSREKYFLATNSKIGRALSYDEIQAHLDRKESLTSPLGHMPFKDGVCTSSSRAPVIFLQGFDAHENPVQGFEGRAIFDQSWEWDARRSRKKPLEWKQWIVDLKGRETATLRIPDEWRHVWIAPVNEARFLPKYADTQIPFGGIQKMDLFITSVHRNLTRAGVDKEESKKVVKETYITYFGGEEFLIPNINPYGPYVRIEEGENTALNDVITWSSDLNADLKGKQITLGINIKEKVEVEPVKVIVGISRSR